MLRSLIVSSGAGETILEWIEIGALAIEVLAVAIIGYITMELPPGDYVSRYVAQLESSGQSGAREQGATLRKLYGLDDPSYIRFGRWVAAAATCVRRPRRRWPAPVNGSNVATPWCAPC